MNGIYITSILYKSIAGRYRPVSYPDGSVKARYRFIKNATWDISKYNPFTPEFLMQTSSLNLEMSNFCKKVIKSVVINKMQAV